MAKRKTTTPATPPASAVVIPFPRFGIPPHRRAGNISSPEFDSGFECAMQLVMAMKARGLIRGRT